MKSQNLLVGIFVSAGLLIFAAGLFLIGNRHQVFEKHAEYYTEFINLSGLAKGAKVRVGGMDAGEVVEIGIPDSPASKFRVKFRIDSKLAGLVRADSVASIETEGVVGDTLLFVHPGSAHSAMAAALSTVPSKEPIDLSDLLDKGQGLLKDADGAIRNVDGAIRSVTPKIDTALDSVNSTIGNVNDVVVGIKQGRGPAGMLLRDEALSGQIRQIVTNAQTATSGINDITVKTNGIISDLEKRQLPQKADDTMRSVQSAAANLDSTSQQVKQTVAEMTAPDEQGVTAGANLRQTLSNTTAATSNLADDTEALKHEFFFKGFFHKRGYYNLDHLSANQYRTDKVFASGANQREWLPASAIFETRPDGSQALTEQGRLQLDVAFFHLGDSAEQSPIVIEGYSEAPNEADQLSVSRSRALLVRSYLQNHFLLDAANLGSVSLRHSPPASAGRPDWDGVCLVLLRKK